MEPETLLQLLFIAANVQSDEEKARIAWRFSDAMWRRMGKVPPGFCRASNNHLQDQEWPWVKDLWSKAEVEADYEAMGMPHEVAAVLVGAGETAINPTK